MTISGEFQDGDALTFKDCFVEVDVNGDGTWVAIDSWATNIAVSGEDIPTSQTYPFKGSVITFGGNPGPAVLQCTIVYTEGSNDAYSNIRDRFEAAPGGAFNIRFVPAGSGAGNKRFTSSGGKLTSCPLPQGGGDAAEANVVQFEVEANSVTSDRM